MGVIPKTHVKRSSGMSLALRSQRDNVRVIFASGIVCSIVTIIFLVLLYGTTMKEVTVVLYGEEKKFRTFESDVTRFLAAQGIFAGEHDRLSVSPDARLVNGHRIIINREIPVQVTEGGTTKTNYSIGKTVENVLKDLNIPLGEHDKISPALDREVAENTEITIVRVNKNIEETSETIDYKVVKRNDPTLPAGKQQLVQKGKEGTLVKRKEKVYEDNVLVAENIIEERVEKESVEQIVAVGTKQPVAAAADLSPAVEFSVKSRADIPAKKILEGVTLSAYSSGGSSGKTASGTRPAEGRTIAVDPRIIPMGWWVYIDGIGFRRAEDTGGAIKGNKIDVYFESDSYAKRFGLKRGYTVYVIGPVKPEAD
ncbi:3D domain-containing protein [Paenibacillus hamazuiensis]|uniref:3D domain-containing protein n=1 Tax=Paenibacillus hamazuiensis TaxID=2936508 RepID=UPI00200C094F|nr:3D domain-containing protein [Paenibacillus hamazuiensis]